MNTTENNSDVGPILSINSTAITRDKKTNLLRIECKHAADPDKEMTPDRIFEIILEQEANWLQSSDLKHLSLDQ